MNALQDATSDGSFAHLSRRYSRNSSKTAAKFPSLSCCCARRYLVNLGCIKPLCDLLTVMDSKIVQVALNGLENILRLGEQEAKQENNGTGVNPYCSLIEEAYGTASVPF